MLGNLAFARLVARRHATSSLQRIPERLVLGEATSKLFSDNISSLEHHGQFEWSDDVRDLPEISRGKATGRLWRISYVRLRLQSGMAALVRFEDQGPVKNTANTPRTSRRSLVGAHVTPRSSRSDSTSTPWYQIDRENAS